MTSQAYKRLLNNFAEPLQLDLFSLPDHDEVLSGDTLTTLTLNYKWRQILGSLLDGYLHSLVSDFGGSDEITYYNQVRDLLDDLYTAESVGITNMPVYELRETANAAFSPTPFNVVWGAGDNFDSGNPTHIIVPIAGWYLAIATIYAVLDTSGQLFARFESSTGFVEGAMRISGSANQNVVSTALLAFPSTSVYHVLKIDTNAGGDFVNNLDETNVKLIKVSDYP